MHTQGDVLLLPNVWDVASARIVEDAGFPAIATSSAGIAFAQGFPDGQKIPPERMLAVIADIASAVKGRSRLMSKQDMGEGRKTRLAQHAK